MLVEFVRGKTDREEFRMIPMCISESEVTLCDGGTVFVTVTREEIEKLLKAMDEEKTRAEEE